VNPHEPDARIAKMKDGSTHLAHKVEHAVDMKTGTVLVVTLQRADQGDTATVQETLLQAGEHVAELLVTEAEKAPEEKPQVYFQGVKAVVTDKGHQSGDVLVEIKDMEVRTYIPEKKQTQRRDWDGQKNQAKARAQQEATYANRRRVGGAYRKSLLRKRGELVERSFAHCYETGGMRRTHLRGQKNILKRLLIHVGAFNLGLLVRTMLGAGKPREWKNRHASVSFFVFWVTRWLPEAQDSKNTPFSIRRPPAHQNRCYLRYLLRHSNERGFCHGL
jgi:Transposase DDE domain